MFRPLIRAALPVALGALILGCNESTSPSAQNSTLTIQVYVDVNGDGQFDSGDVPVAGAQIQALPTGGTAVDLVTLEDGTATASDVPPGTYTLSLVSGAPAGATLATATNPVVVAEYFGGSLEAEFRFAFEPGSISGVVYRDDDESGDYDPEFDTPGAGIPVTVQVTASEEVVGETTTDEDGAFLFVGLRPGNYTLKYFPPETAEIVGGDRTVLVTPEGVTDGTAQFTGSLLIPIAEARATDEGKTVTVEGVVTWQEPFSSSRVYFFQDETGGISTFHFDAPGDLVEGEVIRVTGTRATFRGEVQIGDITVLQRIEVGDPVTPRLVTGEEINAGDYQGELVTLPATVVSVEVLSFGNQLVILRDGAGTEFKVYSDSRTGVESTNWPDPDVAVEVTGVLGTDDRLVGDGGNTEGPRLEVRRPEDVVIGSTVVPIGDARGMAGETVAVEGVVTWQITWSGGNIYFFEDETGGILAFHNSASTDIPVLARGDRIRVAGEVSSFRSEVQISPVSSVQILESGDPLLPKVVSAADINAGLHQGELVAVAGQVLTVEVLSFDNQAVTLDDGGETIAIYVDSRNGVLPDTWTVGESYLVAGVLGTDDRQDLPYRIEPRDIDDIRAAAGLDITSISDARTMDGQEVTLLGSISWQTQFSGGSTYFFQDESAGISAFHSGAPSMSEGDAILVTGTIGAFRGEIQISPTAIEVLAHDDPPEPRVVTGAEINGGQYQGELVTLRGAVVSVDVIDSFENQVVTLRDGDGTEFKIYVDSRTDVFADDWPAVDAEVDVTGVLGNDDRLEVNGSFTTEGPRIEVRRPADVAPVAAPVVAGGDR